MAEHLKRYYVRLQVIEQTGFDDDQPGLTVMKSEVITVPTPRQSFADMQFAAAKAMLNSATTFGSKP